MGELAFLVKCLGFIPLLKTVDKKLFWRFSGKLQGVKCWNI